MVAGEVVAPAFLKEMTSGGFMDVPLEEFCEYVSALHNVSILLDTPALDDEGLTSDMPVTINLDPFPSLDEDGKDKAADDSEKSNVASTAVSLQQGLDWVTRKYELSWYVEEGIIHITSDVAEEQRQVSRSYFIRQFLVDGFTENSLSESVQLMTSGQWQNIDGLGGSLALVGDVLTIRQNWQTHREIELLLATLLDRKKEAAIQYPDESLRVAKLLEQRVDEVNFTEAPLSDLVLFLSDVSGLRIRIDEAAIQEEGWELDTPISITLMNQSVRTILRLALKPLDLQAIVHEGCLKITSSSRAYETLNTVVYDVRDLDDNAGQLEQLEAAIEATNDGPWMVRDGDGGVLLIPGGGRMAVRQTDNGHREIRQLLVAQRRAATLGKTFDATGTALTRTKDAIRASRRGPIEKRFYRVPSETADDLLTVLPASIDTVTWSNAAMFGQGTNLEKSLGTIVKVEVDQKVVRLSDAEARNGSRKKVAGNSAAAGTGTAGGPNVLVVPESVLIIEQTPAIHDKIEKFLQKLDMNVKGVRLEDVRHGGGMSGGGFF